jgi:tetratricopeptide (TPR) repeat protein
MDLAERKRTLGVALEALEAGLWHAAARMCGTMPSGDPDADLLLGLAKAGKGEIAAAARILDRIAADHPAQQHPCHDFARLCPNGPVAPLFQACLSLAPGNRRLRHDFANYLLDHDRPAEAEAVLRHAPDSAAGLHLLGQALTEQGRFRDAVAHFQRATVLDPHPATTWAILGMTLMIVGRFEVALAAYDEAILRSPNDPSIRVNRMVALLQAGRWAEAWAEGDWRLCLPGYRGLGADRLLPPNADVAGRTVLLTHEEGFGDTIQFLRYAPLLAERGATVVARMPAPLMRLARRVPGVSSVIAEDAPLPAYDYHCPMVSLPRAFGTTPDTIPPGDYLAAPINRTPRIGLVWAGQARPWLPGFVALDGRRSAGADAFSPLANLHGVRFVSLQTGPAAAQKPAGLEIEDPMANVRDFMDTAEIVAGLSLVVSVDTAIVHLAGAMGKPVFMLDRYDNCWRWLSGRSDTPWYPHMTIFRQTRPHDWTEPMGRLMAAIEAMLLGPQCRT